MDFGQIKSFFRLSGKAEKRFLKVNLFFVFIFLNIWDLVISRELLNAMILGIVMFLPAIFLWFVGTLRAVVLLTLISIFEFTIMFIFIMQGLALGGFDTTIKSIFWIPYMGMAAANGFGGLKIYSERKPRH